MTRKRVFGLTVALLLAMVAVGGLWAQVAVPGGITSPQATATAGRIRSTADNFIRADSWNAVNFEKWYGMGTFASGSRAGLGYATKIGGLYLGAFYGGTFWAGMEDRTYTDQTWNFFSSGDKTYPTYTAAPTLSNTDNVLSVLIGVADMGFRLSLQSTYRSFKEKDVVIGSNLIKDYKAANGLVRPQLLWSMAKDLTDNGFRPYAAVDLGFFSNYRKSEAYTNASDTSGVNVASSQNYVNPIFTVGSGGYAIYANEGFRLTVDLEYRLSIQAWNNEYSFWDSGKYTVKTIKGTYNGTNYIERSDVFNTLTPNLAGSFNMDKLALRFRLTLPLSLDTAESATMGLKTDGSLWRNGAYAKTTTFGWNPALQLAAQWRAMSKLALNIGASIGPGTLSVATTEGNTYLAGDTLSTTSSTTAHRYTRANASNNLTFGVTFNITDNLTLEASSGVSASGNNNAIVFGTGTDGLLYFTNILASFRL